MERKIGLLDSTVLVAKDGVKELTAFYDATAEKKYWLSIKDGSGNKSIAVTEELYTLVTKELLH